MRELLVWPLVFVAVCIIGPFATIVGIPFLFIYGGVMSFKGNSLIAGAISFLIGVSLYWFIASQIVSYCYIYPFIGFYPATVVVTAILLYIGWLEYILHQYIKLKNKDDSDHDINMV